MFLIVRRGLMMYCPVIERTMGDSTTHLKKFLPSPYKLKSSEWVIPLASEHHFDVNYNEEINSVWTKRSVIYNISRDRLTNTQHQCLTITEKNLTLLGKLWTGQGDLNNIESYSIDTGYSHDCLYTTDLGEEVEIAIRYALFKNYKNEDLYNLLLDICDVSPTDIRVFSLCVDKVPTIGVLRCNKSIQELFMLAKNDEEGNSSSEAEHQFVAAFSGELNPLQNVSLWEGLE